MTVNRMILNETSYFGKGAIENVPTEFFAHNFKKAVVVTDAGLVKVGVSAQVTDVLDKASVPYELYDGIVPKDRKSVV